jgi:large subunit ribosomal protein L35
MPKIKTNRAAAKRFKFTAKGKIKREHAYAGHLLSSKTPARKRRLRGLTFVNGRDAKKIRLLLPNT